MAQYRLSASVISRGHGRSAVACAAYRSGEQLADDRTGQIHDYTRKRGVLHTEIMAPENAPAWMRDRTRLWNAVEAVETRINSRLAREIQLSLPHEMTAEQRRELVRGFVQKAFVDKGMIADLAIHAPGPREDHRNHHAHVMLTMRELTAGGFHAGKATPTARSWNARDKLQEWRKEWELHQNEALAKSGSRERVDSRSYEAQGVDREPTKHLGPSAHQMEKRGQETRIGNENRAANENNRNRADRHGILVALQTQIDRLDGRFTKQEAERVQAVENEPQWTRSDLKSKHQTEKQREWDRLDGLYGESMRTLAAERQTLESRIAASGWRKVLRDATGRTGRDADRLDRVKLNYLSAAERVLQGMDALETRQSQQTAALEKAHEQRKAQIAEETRKEKEAARAALMKRRKVAAEAYEKRQAEQTNIQPARKPLNTRAREIAAEALAKPPTPAAPPAPVDRQPYRPDETVQFARAPSQEAQAQRSPPSLPDYREVWGRRAGDNAAAAQAAAAKSAAPEESSAMQRRAEDQPAPRPISAGIPDAKAAHDSANLSMSEQAAKFEKEARWTDSTAKPSSAWDWYAQQAESFEKEAERAPERGLSLGLKFNGGE